MINILRLPCVAKVLPTVYDDTLSYYELLNKTVDKLNELIETVNTDTASITELKMAVLEIQRWIDNFDEEGFAKLTGADFIGAITTTSTVTADEGFVGNLTGDVTGNLTGYVTGNVTGDLTGNVTGNVTGNLTGNVTGNVTGDLTGDVTGDVTGNLTGNVTGNVRGDVIGDVQGDLIGNVTGNLTGNVSGNVTGNVSGNVTGNVSGTLTGDSHGTHYGGVVGNVTGNLTGLADEAKVLDTPRSLVVDLASDSSESFDGSADADLGVKGVLPVEHGGTGNSSVDSAPTAGSTKMVTSGGVKTALDAKQDTLTFDIAPTLGSQNPVTSDGIFNAISQAGVGVVSSVFGRTGIIIAGDGDYNAGQVTYSGTASGLNATRVQGAIDEVVGIINNLPHSLAGCSDVEISAPTDGQVLKYDVTTQKWKNGADVSGIAPNNVSGLALTAGNEKVTIKWSDPDDTVISGQTICTWKMTKLVMKLGGFPTDENDGTVIISNSVRDQYAVNGYEVTGLTNGTTYYFQLFPVSDGNAVNRNADNRVSGTPMSSVQITLTINGAKEDTITITNSDNETVGTVVFEAGQTSGTFTTLVAPSYSNVWTFTSAVAKISASDFYSKNVTVTDAVSQTINCYPDKCWHWYGNKLAGMPTCSLPISEITHGFSISNSNNYNSSSETHFPDPVDVSNCTSLKVIAQGSFSGTSGTCYGWLGDTASTAFGSHFAIASFANSGLSYASGSIPSGHTDAYARVNLQHGGHSTGYIYAMYAE